MNDAQAEPSLIASAGERNPIELLADEFIARYRQGERPALSEYTANHPDLADEIRELFPALVLMERLKPAASEVSGAGPIGTSGIPDQIGDYRIIREIGRGGMGVVYEALQLSLGRHVALKVLPVTSRTSAVMLERFRREAKAAARLHHTNIVPVFGVGEEGGISYFAMQFIQGEPLDRVLEDVRRLREDATRASTATRVSADPPAKSTAQSLWTGRFAALPQPADSLPSKPAPLPTSRSDSSATLSGTGSDWKYCRAAARIGIQASEALAYAHRQGVLHRDIKPSNLLLDAQGTLWITDFGLAKSEGSAELTNSGDIVGTLRYLAPERFDGRSLPQSDIYGLGLTLYEMLALQPAFDDADRPRLIQKILHTPPPRIRKLNPEIPRDLETIIMKAIAHEPSGRYATAEALTEDLRRFLSDRPVRARRASPPERLMRWCRRNRTVAALTGLILLLLIFAAIGSSIAALSLNALRNDALAKLGRSKLNEAVMLTQSRQPGQRFASLDRTREALAIADRLGSAETDRLELRNAAIAALALPDFEESGETESHIPVTGCIAFDSSLERYASMDSAGNVSLRKLGGDEEIAAIPGVGRRCSSRMSSDARFIALSVGDDNNLGELSVWRLDAKPPTCLHKGHALTAIWSEFTPDCRHYLYVDRSHVTVLDLETGRVHPPWSLPRAGLACNPDGDRVAVGQATEQGGVIEIRNLATGVLLKSLPLETPASSIAWHPDGRLLAVACERRYPIALWDVDTGKKVSVFEGHKNGGIVVRFSHAGDRMLSTDWSGVMRLWNVDSGGLLLNFGGSGSFPLFGPQDWCLVDMLSQGGQECLRLRRFAPGRELRPLLHRSSALPLGYHEPRFSPDGRWVAVATLPRNQQNFSGMSILSWPDGREVVTVQSEGVYPMRFDTGGALWTHGGEGLLKWHASQNSQSGAVALGPPQPSLLGESAAVHDVSPDGSVVLFTSGTLGTAILHRRGGDRLIPTGFQEDVRYGAISPDGTLVVTGSHFCLGKAAKVWESRTGQLVHEFALGGTCQVGFSPDQRWLVTANAGVRLWRVGTWEERELVHLEGDATGWAFSPDGELLALGGQGHVRLIRLSDGVEVARLPIGEQARAIPVCFSPGGNQLLIEGQDSESLLVWDMLETRKHLVELGLDWEGSISNAQRSEATPATESGSYAPAGQKLELLGAETLLDLPKLKERGSAQALLALSRNPLDSSACFQLARLAENDRPESAYALYCFSLALEPDQIMVRIRRAVCAAYLQFWPVALADTEAFLAVQPERVDARYLRARLLHKLGRHADALAELKNLETYFTENVRYYLLRAEIAAARGDLAQAGDDRGKAAEFVHVNPIPVNDRAWQMLTGPLLGRNPREALELARMVAATTPLEPGCLNTLGVAEYRNRLYREARATLTRSLAESKDRWDAYDLFFLSMCHQRLGDPAKARAVLARAKQWLVTHAKLDRKSLDELNQICEEAETCISTSAKDLP
jgi:serine/threonine protein kinase/WD40 repeat protein/tetratricopeptide (TPR) repeat protein